MFMQAIADRLQQFTGRLIERLGSSVECVVLTGSHARGDARPDSDIDVWVFLTEVSDSALQEVGRVVAALGEGPELNPQCLTFAEARCQGFKKGFSVLQLHLDGVMLHGTLKLPEPTKEDIRQDCLELAAFCLMSARHYITVREPDTVLLRKLDRFLLKPLVWAIRYEVFLRTGTYNRASKQLCQAITDPDTRSIVSACQDFRHSRYQGPCMPVIDAAARVCSRMIAENG
jgi:predicted nucleotidyltransferase